MQFWEIKWQRTGFEFGDRLSVIPSDSAVIALFRVPVIFFASPHFTGTFCMRPCIFLLFTGKPRADTVTDRLRSARKS
jgi:hypothetical protein